MADVMEPPKYMIWVPLKEAAEMVGLCEKTLMKMAKEGKVKIKQPNGPHGKRLVKVASLQDFDAKAKHDNVRIPAHFRFCSSLRC